MKRVENTGDEVQYQYGGIFGVLPTGVTELEDNKAEWLQRKYATKGVRVLYPEPPAEPQGPPAPEAAQESSPAPEPPESDSPASEPPESEEEEEEDAAKPSSRRNRKGSSRAAH